LKNVILNLPDEVQAKDEKEIFIAEFVINDKPKRVELAFSENVRLSVGRTKENDLMIDDQSISKIHAALVLNSDKQLMVADTGSTNGTFINGQRMAYGRAFPIKTGDKINFGTVVVTFEHIPKEVEEVAAEEFQTQQDFKTQEVSAGELPSSPTVFFPKEEVSAQNDFKTQPDFSTKGDIFQTEASLTQKKEIERKEKFAFADKIKTEEDAEATKERIELDFSEKN